MHIYMITGEWDFIKGVGMILDGLGIKSGNETREGVDDQSIILLSPVSTSDTSCAPE